MSSLNEYRYFNGTCELFDLQTCQGEVLNFRFLDPCSCKRSYQCTQTYEMEAQLCPEDTLWDSNLGRCNHEHEVLINQACSETNSWTRCNTTEERLQQLRHLCTNIPPTTASPTTDAPIETTTAPPSADSPDTNIGLIVGLSVTIVVVIVLIVLFILYRRKHRSGIKKKRETIAHNPEYFENGNREDPYAVIDDRMTSPVYDSHTQNQANGGFSNTGYNTSFEHRDDPVTYDNSVERTPQAAYTSTLNRSFREYGTLANASSQQTTSSGETLWTTGNHSLDVVNDDRTKMAITNLDENGNRNSDSSNNANKLDEDESKEPTVSDAELDNLAETYSTEQNKEPPHDYFVLSASDKL